MSATDVVLRDQLSGSGTSCRSIFDQLPTWFGIPAAVEDDVADADRSPCIVASRDGHDVGILTLKHHSPYAADVDLMAVVPSLPRHGIGRTMRAERQNTTSMTR